MTSPLLSTQELENSLHNPNLVIVDARFDLANPDWGQMVYLESHIPGAIYMNLNRDLSGRVTTETGRHPLPSAEDFARRLGCLGVSRDSEVVVYDSNGGAFADRLWWMLRMVGHPKVRVLDGSFQKWQRESRPLSSGLETRESTHYPVIEFNPSMFATATEVLNAVNQPNFLIIDARAPERYRGEVEPIDPIAGHIPSAVNRFHGLNLRPDGTLIDKEKLRSEFSALIGDRDPANVIIYCGSGVTSIHHLLAMEYAGLPTGRVYIGSWSEWIRDPSRPRIP